MLKMDADYQENLRLLTDRVGHVSIQYEDQLIVVWGGYDRSKEESSSYYEPSEIVMFNVMTRQIQTVTTTGDIPPKTCGSSAVVQHKSMYVMGGFITEGAFVENTNAIYCLNLATKNWSKIEPQVLNDHPQFLKADKLSAWAFDCEIFVFGGYGPAPENSNEKYPAWMHHVLDPEYLRGWSNQLVIYNVSNNTLKWAESFGDIPGPRAAHATVCDKEARRVYLFGGRFGSDRLQDFYWGDLSHANGIRWVQLKRSEGQIWPSGRSWHTLNLVGQGLLLLYGGYDKHRRPLNDCWLFDVELSQWTKLKHHCKEFRLWHTAHHIQALDSVFLFGGVRHDILKNVPDMHPGTLDRIQLSPLSLSQLALKVVKENPRHYRKFLTLLPLNVQMQIIHYYAQVEGS